MSRGSINSLSVVFIIIGIVVGGASGYFYGNSVFQPVFNDLDGSVSELESQVTEKTSEADQLQMEVQSLETEKTGKELQLVSLENEQESVRQTLQEKQSVFSGLKLQRENLEELVTPEPGTEKFCAFGISFNYPEDMPIQLTSSIGDASSSMGNVLGETSEGIEIGVSWASVPYYPSIIDAGMNGSITVITSIYDVTVGERQNTTICGYNAKYQTVEGVIEGNYEYNIFFAFYCDSNNSIYFLGFSSRTESDFAKYQDFIDSFRVEG